jgi:hypothetical protein
MGVVIVTNEVSMDLGSQGSMSSSVNVSQTKAALRVEGCGSISVGAKFSILLSAGYDIVMGPKEKNTYYTGYNDPAFSYAGGIANLAAGLTYGF